MDFDKIKKIPILKNTRLLITLLICLIILIVSKTLSPVQIAGQSMNPTLKSGELYSTTKDVSNIQKGDIIVFAVNKDENNKEVFIDAKNEEELSNFNPKEKDKKDLTRYLVKRVVATPGEIVQIKEGHLYINDKKIEDDFEDMNDAGVAKDPIKLKEDEFFCLGDNRNESRDSRVLGPIPQKTIVGKLKNRIF